MNVSKKIVTILCIFISIFTSSIVNAQAIIDVESGGVFSGYNDVQIPGNTGSSFSLKNDLNAKPNGFIRIRAGYKIKNRHTVSLLLCAIDAKI